MKRLGCKQHTHDQGSLRKYLWRNKYLYLLLIPGILYFIILDVYKRQPLYRGMHRFPNWEPMPLRSRLKN